MSTPEFVVVGHVVRDLVAQGWRWGGTAAFAAAQALRLGLQVGVVTRAGAEANLEGALPGAMLARGASSETTTFENVYEGGRRSQRVLVRSEVISAGDIPSEWRSAPMALLGPVCGEVPAGVGEVFSESLVGVSAQGWLRKIDREHRVHRAAWTGAPFWSSCDVLFVSDEDLGSRRDQLSRWCVEVPVVVLTRNRRGARVHVEGEWRNIAAFPAQEIDPTGAGDVFAAAFLARYRECADIGEASRFASAAAACSIEGAGIDAIAGRDAIEERMAAHPEVVLR